MKKNEVRVSWENSDFVLNDRVREYQNDREWQERFPAPPHKNKNQKHFRERGEGNFLPKRIRVVIITLIRVQLGSELLLYTEAEAAATEPSPMF